MNGNTRHPIPGPQAGWSYVPQEIVNDADSINLSHAGRQQQQVPPSTASEYHAPFLAEPQLINPDDDAYRDNVLESTESLDDPDYFSQTGATMSAQYPPATANSAMEMGMTLLDTFHATANVGVDQNGLNSYPAPPTTRYYANEVPGPAVGTPTPMTMPNTPATQGNLRSPWTAEQDAFLLANRKRARKYDDIAQDMTRTFPSMGIISTNRLVKRMRRIKGQDLDAVRDEPPQPLPEAVRNAMSRIIDCIKEEIEKVEYSDGSRIQTDMNRQIMEELRVDLPGYVQSKVTSKLRAQQNTSPTRDAES